MATSKLYTYVKTEDQLVYFKSSDPKIAEKEGTNYDFKYEPTNQDFLLAEVDGYQPPPAAATNTTSTTNNGAGGGSPPLKDKPHDPRLVFISGVAAGKDILSFSAGAAEPLMEGFVLPENPNDKTGTGKKISAQNLDDIAAYPGSNYFAGVPALMNPNAYISFQQFKASKDATYLSKLMDQENEARWYEIDQYNKEKGHRYKSPTVSELVAWSQEPANLDKMPYRFQDFAYCKYWQKVPNNYLVTLRRYPFPTSDNLQVEGADHAANTGGKIPGEKIRPIATAVTWLGETTGNKISAILGPIDSGLNWKDLKSEMNTVSPASPGDAGAGPMPGIAKWLGMIGGTTDGSEPQSATPPDPYTEGPWQNKIIGPINVIDSVKTRERGLKFEHKISLVFEYSARSIGGINTKAAMLDVLSNLLLMTSASASFWGGANRFSPGSPGNTAPFLGGAKGRAAWMSGDVTGFLDSVTSQFSEAASAVSDFLFQAAQDPISAMKSLVSGGLSTYMKSNSGSKGGMVTGLKAILTGEPVGEWHLQVGNPFNPMMMIGNLICTGIKLEFNDELGPDDFPTELKATITLEHGRPRDRDAIESMFNGGGGRLYSLPAGYEKSFSSSSQTAVDKYTGGKKKAEGGEGNTGTKKPSGAAYRSKSVLFGDPRDVDRAINQTEATVGKTYSTVAAKWGLGWTKTADKKPKA